RARRRPGNGIALRVGDGDGGVVERRIHMRHTGSDVLALTAAYAGGILAHLKNLSNDLNAAVMPAATPVRRVVSSEWRIELFATPYSPFALLLLLAGDRLGRPLARAGVGMGGLTPPRQPAAMTQAAIAAEVHQTLDVHADFATKIALDQIVAVDHFADLQHFLVAQLTDATVNGNFAFSMMAGACFWPMPWMYWSAITTRLLVGIFTPAIRATNFSPVADPFRTGCVLVISGRCPQTRTRRPSP